MNTLRLAALFGLVIASVACNGRGNDTWDSNRHSHCPIEEGPLWRGASEYVVTAAPAGLEHLVGASVVLQEYSDGDLTIRYRRDGLLYEVKYQVENVD